MTPETAAFLLQMLDGQSVTIGHPDAEAIAARAFAARAELIALLNTPPD